MEVKITTLSENTANHGFLAEWGLSILIEVDKMRILVDTGMSFSATHNSQLLGIDLATIDRIVLSHGHRDHTGGLHKMLRVMRREVEIIAHPDVWSAKYTRHDEKKEQYSGIPFCRETLESLGARFNLTKKPIHITEHVLTTGEIPTLSDYEGIEDNLLVREDGVLHPDPLADDLALIIDTSFGLVVISGCAHRGIVNTLRHAQKLTGGKAVYAVIGGTHLYRAKKDRVTRTIVDLRDMGIKKLGVSHCTGFYAAAKLAEEFEGIFFLNNAGTRLTLP